MAMWVWERERKRMRRCNSADRRCVACSGQHHVAGNGADFSKKAVCIHEMRADLERKAGDPEEFEKGLDSPRSGSQPAPVEVGRHRSLSDSLAGAGRRY